MKRSNKSIMVVGRIRKMALKKNQKRRRERARSTKTVKTSWKMRGLVGRGRRPEINRRWQLRTRLMKNGSKRRWEERKIKRRESETLIN